MSELEQTIHDSAIVISLIGIFVNGISMILSYEKKSVNKLGKYWGFAIYAFLGSSNIVCGMVGWHMKDWPMMVWHPILGLGLLYFWLFVVCATKKAGRTR